MDTNRTGYADLILHNPTNSAYFWQWYSKTDLGKPGPWPFGWAPGEVKPTPFPADDLWYTPLICTNPAGRFFRAVGATNVAYVLPSWPSFATTALRPDANGDGGVDSAFYICVSNTVATDLTVYYVVGGTAVYGVDYTNQPGCLTNANGFVFGSAVIPAGWNTTRDPVDLSPIHRDNPGFGVMAVITLLPGEGYVANGSASIPIMDQFAVNPLTVVANIPAELGSVADLDYLTTSNCLVLSVGYWWGTPFNFALLATNGSTTQWSSAVNMYGEVNIATVKVTADRFTAGYTFFSWEEFGDIGWVANDGTNWDPAWSSVTVIPTLGYGDLYFDQTGLWGNELLVVAGPRENDGSGGLYRISPDCVATPILTNLPTPYLEGLLTLPDEPRYGPWAAKLLTGNETNQTIYAIDTNRQVQAWNIGITGQKFLIIPTNQTFYCQSTVPSAILKLSTNYFASHEGDILVIQCPEQYANFNFITFPAALFILRWNSGSSGFDVWPLFLSGLPDIEDQPMWTGQFGDVIERGVFAPFDMAPAQ